MLAASWLQWTYHPYNNAILNRAELLSLCTTIITQMLSVLYFWIDTNINSCSARDDVTGGCNYDQEETLLTVFLILVNIDTTCTFISLIG